jgi:hypothetical protein
VQARCGIRVATRHQLAKKGSGRIALGGVLLLAQAEHAGLGAKGATPRLRTPDALILGTAAVAATSTTVVCGTPSGAACPVLHAEVMLLRGVS